VSGGSPMGEGRGLDPERIVGGHQLSNLLRTVAENLSADAPGR